MQEAALEYVNLGAVFGVGAALGICYFGLLWKTVGRLVTAHRPVLLGAISFFGRAGGVAAGFYLLAGGRWERLIAALAGFILAREVCLRFLGRVRESPSPQIPLTGGEGGTR